MNADLIGKMGWGEFDTDSSDRKLLIEQRRTEKLQKEAPQLFQPSTKLTLPARLQAEMDKIREHYNQEPGSFDLRWTSHLLFGEIYKWKAQLIGSCVGSGAMRACAFRMMAEIALLGEPEQFFGLERFGPQSVAPFGPYHYGCGRRRGNMKGGDGSYCSVQIEALAKDGLLPCHSKLLQQTNPGEFPEPQSSNLYRKWGSWKYLDEVAADAKDYLLTETADVRDGDDLVKKISEELSPTVHCSSWGFEPSYKHKDGFWVYKHSTTWHHNMTDIAIRVASDGDKFAGILNSWGPNAHKDGEVFYIPLDLYTKWVKKSECKTVAQIDMKDVAPPIFT